MSLSTIIALDAYLRACEKGTDAESGEIQKAFEELKRQRAQTTFADPGLLERARQRYANRSSDDVEIDDGAITSEGDGGTWVNAWVWVAE